MKQEANGEEAMIKKPGRFMANSTLIGTALSVKCQGRHRHIELTGGGMTNRSEVYPDSLCIAILEGLVSQMIKMISGLDARSSLTTQKSTS